MPGIQPSRRTRIYAAVALCAVGMRPVVSFIPAPHLCPTTTQRATPVHAGFGGGKSGGDKKLIGTGASAIKKQQAIFIELRGAGATPTEVHARAAGTDKWFKVGQVVAEGGAVAEAVQAQKRLILEAAAEIYPVLKPNQKTLEAGFTEGEEIKACPKVMINVARVGLMLELPEGGLFFKKPDRFGLSDRVDPKSSAGRISRAAAGGNDPSKANAGKMGRGGSGGEGG